MLDHLRRSSLVRLMLLPDEVNLVYRVVQAQPEVPRVMIDVGAHVGSTLASFAAAGWRVCAFEPDPRNRALLERAYPHVEIDPRAVSNQSAQSVAFFTSPVSSGVSSLAPFVQSHVESTRVSTISLDDACRERGIAQIGVLKVDVEGFDLHVLQGVPWSRLQPHAVVCEFEDAKTTSLGYSFFDLANFLVARGYTLLVSEWYPVVRYGVAHRWRRLTRYPCRLADPRCFGNLIAFRDPHLADAAERLAQPWVAGWRAFSTLRSALAACGAAGFGVRRRDAS